MDAVYPGKLESFPRCFTRPILKVHASGYYAWLAGPKSAQSKDDPGLLGLIKYSWLESDGVYGYCEAHEDLRGLGDACGKYRVASTDESGRAAHADRVLESTRPLWRQASSN